MHYITSSFLDKTLKPLQRIYRIWYATFSLRVWRFWLCNDSPYHLNINLISSNAYLCVELCAHSIVLTIMLLQELYSSQCCECYFRAARACSTFGSTQVNFSLKKFLCGKCRKEDASLRATSEGVKHEIRFPRYHWLFDAFSEEILEESNSGCYIPKILTSLDDIKKAIFRAKNDAEADLAKIGGTSHVINLMTRFFIHENRIYMRCIR